MTFSRRIILARHAETEANRARRFAGSEDVPLTNNGRQQARELGLWLAREFKVDALISSTYLRARQTSAASGEGTGLNPEVTLDIHEREFGSLKGHPYDRMGELMLADPAYDCARPWRWAPPGGESMQTVQERAVKALVLLSHRSSREMVVVSHGAVIQAICAYLTADWNESFVPPNCGVQIIEFDGELESGRARLKKLTRSSSAEEG